MNQQEVQYLTPLNTEFESNYLAVRAKEDRVYSDEVVLKLPNVAKNQSQYKEWNLRVKTVNRFIDYLTKESYNNVLDIGCGNGWFTNILSHNIAGDVLGLDVNKDELEQAVRVFNRPNLKFAYGDLFQADFETKFDLIVLNASIQYFPDLNLLLDRLKSLLTKFGEIHILDSPFYDSLQDCNEAKERTVNYYTQLGYPEMAEFYFHHQKTSLKDFQQLYKPKSTLIKKLLKKVDSPFGWYCFKMNKK